MANVIALVNHKGGVGKSTVAFNLGYLLAESFHVLMIDMDSQHSLTVAAGIGETGNSIARVMGGAANGDMTLAEIIVPVADNLDIAPSSAALAVSELGMGGRMGRDFVLRAAIESIRDDYDVILIDCPPTLNLMALNALAAADGVICPTAPRALDLNGLKMFLDTLQNARQHLGNPSLQLIGIVPTFVNMRTRHHREAIGIIEAGNLPLLPAIGASVKIAESMDVGLPLHMHDKRNKQAAAFRALADKVAIWLNENQ